MIGCFKVGDEVLQLREALEKLCNLAEMCYQTKNSLKY